ncbi:hypothetical protein [Jiulongibacter sp. NS-SX5]
MNRLIIGSPVKVRGGFLLNQVACHRYKVGKLISIIFSSNVIIRSQ